MGRKERDLQAALDEAGARLTELREIIEHRDAQAERDAEATVRAMQEADARTMEARQDRDAAVRAVADADVRLAEYRERLESVRSRRDALDQQLRAGPVEGAAAYWKDRCNQAQTSMARARERMARQRVQIRDLTARHVLTKKGFESQARTIGRLTAELEQATDDLVEQSPVRLTGPAILVSPDQPLEPSVQPGGWITVSEGAKGWHSPVLQVLSVRADRNVDGDCYRAVLEFAGARAGAAPEAAIFAEGWRPRIPRRQPTPLLTTGALLTIRFGPEGQTARYRIDGFEIDSEHGLTHLSLEYVSHP